MTNVCPTCSSRRANIRCLPCGHVFHDRCLFPWPFSTCPASGCQKQIVNFECVKIEEFYHGDVKHECSNLVHVFGINRRGRWTDEEYEYALALIEAFNAGLVHLPESLKLGSFLCKMLQCCSARLSSKIRKGKKVFHSKRIQDGTALDSFEIAHYRSVQQKLSDAEDEFLTKIATSFDIEEAAVLSYHIQHSWQKGFLASTHFEVAKHAFINPNCCATESSRSIVGGKLIGEVHKGINEKILSRNMLISCLRSVAHRYVSWPLETNGLQMLSDLTKQFSSSVALAIHVESHNVLHVSSSFQSIISQFITKDSFLCADDLEFVFKNHRELLTAITDRSLSSAAGRINSADDVHQINRKLELILVDDGKCECIANVLYIGSISLSVLQFSRISTGPFDEEKDGEFIEIFDAELVEKALSAYNREDTGRGSNTRQSHGSYPRSLPCEVAVGKINEYGTNAGHAFGGKKNRIESVRRQPEGGSYCNDDKFRRPTYRSIAQSSEEVLYSSSSMSLQRACGGFLLTSDKHNVPQQVGTNHCPVETASDALITYPDFYSLAGESNDLEEGGPCAEEILTRNPIVNIVYSGRSGNTRGNSGKSKSLPVMTSADRDNAPTLLSATTTVDLPLFYGMSQIPSIRPLVVINFESILQSILRVIPFHVVEIWLPVQLEDGSTVLLFGASAALDKALLGWSSYSRNFSFNPDVGLPGRVAAARIAESRTDVATLPMPTFLRADMAGSLGIHAACGLPFFTGNKCDAVVVFYSRHIFEPTPSLIEYMGGVCEMLNIRARIRILKPHGESTRS